jgi:DNA-binding response OmpR family regulator
MTKYRALVVDDEPPVRHMTARALQQLGFDCVLSSDGSDALKLVRQAAFDVVVTDLRMPDVNGHKLATELLGLKQRPIVSVLTGIEEPKIAKDLTARGIDRIYYKPVDYRDFSADLLALVEERARANTFREKISIEPLVTPINGLDVESVAAMEVAAPAELDRYSCKPIRDGAAARNDCGVGNIEHNSVGMTLSKIETELRRTRYSLMELERAVGGRLTNSCFFFALTTFIALIAGMVLGWISCQFLRPPVVFK